MTILYTIVYNCRCWSQYNTKFVMHPDDDDDDDDVYR